MQTSDFMKQFANLVCDQLNTYKPEGYEDNWFEAMEITRNNGAKIPGITTEENEKVAPRIHIDKLYDDYCDGELTIEQAADYVREAFSKELKSKNIENVTSYFSKMLSDFSKVKDYIVPILVNKEKNLVMLENIPYVQMENLIIIFRIILPEDGKKNIRNFRSTLVTNEICDMWKQTGDEITVTKLYRIASENGKELLPPYVKSLQEFSKASFIKGLIDRGYSDEEICKQVENYMKTIYNDPVNKMLVITNEKFAYGASVIMYTDVLTQIYDQYGPFYIIPSSIHELLAVQAGYISPEEVLKMVKEVNASDQVSEEDFLANSVYEYTFPSGLKQIL